ncbi:MAG: hypothetical protein U9N34_09065 [Candidatus Cloacimonadota bacterium]|nr:hypothetical protein [Candidatus Cloacimonadota bacterium]
MDKTNESLDSYIQQSLKSRKSKGKKADNNQLYLIAAGAISVVILVGLFIFLFSKGSAVNIEKTKLSNIVYKKVFFERYVVAGNYNEGSRNNKFGKMVIFYIKGNADVKFDLQNLKLKKNGEEYTAVYFNKKAKKKLSTNSLPFTIDVNIDQNNFKEVKEIQPEEISLAEAKKVAAPVGVLAGIGGGVIGAKLGASVGSVTGNPIFSLAGLGIGGVAGGAAAGAGGYVATTNFLTGLQLTSNIGQGDKEKILYKLKLLVASDLLMNDSIANKLTKDFEKYVKSFYEQFGIEVSKISYQNQA